MANRADRKYILCIRPPTCMYCGKMGNEKNYESIDCPEEFNKMAQYC